MLERGASEIRYQYEKQVKVIYLSSEQDKSNNRPCLLTLFTVVYLQVLAAVVVTWEKMQPLGSAPLPDDVGTS